MALNTTNLTAMGYFSLDVRKAKGSSSTAQSNHIDRVITPSNADPTRTHLNRELLTMPDGVHGREEAISYRIKTAGITRKIADNQVRALNIMLSGTHEDMMNIYSSGRLDEWCNDCTQWLADTFGEENVVSAVLHMDEKSPHIHATVIPIVKGERRKAKKEQTNGKKKYRKKANQVRLCADDVVNRQKLLQYHDSFAVVMKKYGLKRGIRGSQARHISTTEYYRNVQKSNVELTLTNSKLIQQNEAAKEKLKEVKSEIRSKKLKSVATDTATALVSGVGYLFGSGKMRSLEGNIQNLENMINSKDTRISHLKKQITEIEKQHTKELEKKDSAFVQATHKRELEYNQQNQFLSNLLHKARKWFPYLDDLFVLEKECLDMGLSENEFDSLTDFQEHDICCSLYSAEHKRRFEAKHRLFQIGYGADNHLTLYINQKPFREWFKFVIMNIKQTIQPRQQQSRGRGVRM